ncbi:MAG: DUF5916 domain-containing protein, partial [Bacteroidota bacterium]
MHGHGGEKQRVSIRLVCALLAPLVCAAGPSPRIITAVRTPDPPVVDGRLEEAAWHTAPPSADFTQYDPEEGAAPTESTLVRVLYDDRALYVGVLCRDAEPGLITRRLTRRDRSSESDRFTVQIDSYHDYETAFVFSVNAAGVQSDGILSQDGVVYDQAWDGVWQAEPAVTPEGWSAEFAVPFHALRFTPMGEGEQVWGVNFRRFIARKRETVEWVMIPRSEQVSISRWGELRGLAGIEPPLHLDLLPYVSGTIRSGLLRSGSGSRQEAAAGLDVKYGVSQNLTLDAAVNPDFGQVEVDRAVLNLSVFEPLFPEKRPFFTEGSPLFAFGSAMDNTALPLYFSRRVGRRPGGSGLVPLPPGGTLEEDPQSTTILGAAKLTGRVESGLSIG